MKNSESPGWDGVYLSTPEECGDKTAQNSLVSANFFLGIK